MNENINIKQKSFIINESSKLFYYKGYNNTNLTDIFESCNITNDTFFKNFSSKNELLIDVIKFHTNNLIGFFNKVVNDLSIEKLKEFFEKYFETIEQNRFHGGSPLGNFVLELSDINEDARKELNKSYKKLELRISFFLTTLKYSSNQYEHIDTETYSRLLISLLEGTMLRLKLEKNNLATKDFLEFFDNIFSKTQEKIKETSTEDISNNSSSKDSESSELSEQNENESAKFQLSSKNDSSQNHGFLNHEFGSSISYYSNLDKVKVSNIVHSAENDNSQKEISSENFSNETNEKIENDNHSIETIEDIASEYKPIFTDDDDQLEDELDSKQDLKISDDSLEDSSKNSTENSENTDENYNFETDENSALKKDG